MFVDPPFDPLFPCMPPVPLMDVGADTSLLLWSGCDRSVPHATQDWAEDLFSKVQIAQLHMVEDRSFATPDVCCAGRGVSHAMQEIDASSLSSVHVPQRHMLFLPCMVL